MLRWYYATRALGAFLLLYGLLVDDSPERTTIIITGGTLVGADAVARSERK